MSTTDKLSTISPRTITNVESYKPKVSYTYDKTKLTITQAGHGFSVGDIVYQESGKWLLAGIFSKVLGKVERVSGDSFDVIRTTLVTSVIPPIPASRRSTISARDILGLRQIEPQAIKDEILSSIDEEIIGTLQAGIDLAKNGDNDKTVITVLTKPQVPPEPDRIVGKLGVRKLQIE